MMCTDARVYDEERAVGVALARVAAARAMAAVVDFIMAGEGRGGR